MDRPHYFQDTMIQGAFRLMQSRPLLSARLGRGETEMRDVFCFAAPLPVLGRVAEIVVLRRYMQGLLRERNAVIRDDRRVGGKWQRYLR